MKYTLTTRSLHEMGQRTNQEDTILPALGKTQPNDRLFLVCDGMGGHEHGEVASQTVCQVIGEMMSASHYRNEIEANREFCQAMTRCYDELDAKESPDTPKKMGTTLTLLSFTDSGVMACHIGDSRIYQLRPAHDGEAASIVFRTRDHSLVQALLDTENITEEEARNHPQKNVVTRVVMPFGKRDLGQMKQLADVRQGDYFFMCTDGILEQLEDNELLALLTDPTLSDDEKIERLRQLTEENHDNHSCHLIHVDALQADEEAEDADATVPEQEAADEPTEPQESQKENAPIEIPLPQAPAASQAPTEEEEEPKADAHWGRYALQLLILFVVITAMAWCIFHFFMK